MCKLFTSARPPKQFQHDAHEGRLFSEEHFLGCEEGSDKLLLLSLDGDFTSELSATFELKWTFLGAQKFMAWIYLFLDSKFRF